MTTLVRLIGALFILLALANLGGLLYLIFSSETDLLHSPVAIGIRYGLLLAAGFGLALLRKWGALIYLAAVLFNWFAYFVVYGDHSPLTPAWIGAALPILVGVLLYLAWDKLSWRQE